MSMHSRSPILVFCALVLLGLRPAGVSASAITTATASIPLTETNWGPTTPGIGGNPLTIAQFNSEGGTQTLDSVTLTVNTQIQVQGSLTFTTPASESLSLASGDPQAPGPTITLYGPDGATPLLTAQSPNDPSFLTNSHTVTSGTNPGTTTYTFGPSSLNQTYTLTLNSPADLALFTGTGTISLPTAATASSTFSCTSGNGSAVILTSVGIDLSATYQYQTTPEAQQIVPEPGTVALWTMSGLGLFLFRRFRGR